MNDVLDVLKNRRSVRAYKDSMPSKDVIEKIMEAGSYAPTGRNQQSPVIIAVTDKTERDYLSRLNAAVLGTDNDPFYGAPVVLVVLADRKCPTFIYDGSLVMGNLMNAAFSLGIGSCWVHRAKEVFNSEEGKKKKKKWGLTDDYEGIGHCILGYPVSENIMPASPRKPDYCRFV